MDRVKPEPVAVGSGAKDGVRPVAFEAEEGERSSPFEAALVASRARLFRTAYLMLGSREEAEDATQRTLVKALESKSRFRAESEVYTWLYRILVNQCKDAHKTRSRAGRWLLPGTEGRPEPEATDPTAEERLSALERDHGVRRALDSLEPRLREVLVLRHYRELSYDEMASVLEVPIGTVRSRLSAARERMRQALESGAGTVTERGGKS